MHALRFGEWLWQGARLEAFRARLRSTPPRVFELRQRARETYHQASQLLLELGPSTKVQLLGPAVRLLVASLTASLQARAIVSGAESEGDTNALWKDSADFLRSTLADENERELLSQLITSPLLTTEGLVSLSEVNSCSVPDALVLYKLAGGFVEQGDSAARGVEAIWFARALRVGAPLLGLVVIALVASVLLKQAQLNRETMIPWRISSGQPGLSCESPRQGCFHDHFFFHTRQQVGPWIEFDLREFSSVSQLVIKNRSDCAGCSAMAVPLAVEVSDDQRTWTEVARRDADFLIWTVKFPRQRVRWLRLRGMRRTTLHLKQVRILP